MINSPDQLARHVAALPDAPFGIQLDSGMNRLGMEPAEWAAARATAPGPGLALIMSHLACADEPDHPMNARQLAAFRAMTDGVDAPRSLANTGGVLLGAAYRFDLTRPGIGVYGGLPYADARPVVQLDVPVIQCRTLEAGETVGYANAFTARRKTRIATIAAGYADGLPRALESRGLAFAGGKKCPFVGRISMDLIGVDIGGLDSDPATLELLGPRQSIDALAAGAGTVGYEILTSRGARHRRRHVGG